MSRKSVQLKILIITKNSHGMSFFKDFIQIWKKEKSKKIHSKIHSKNSFYILKYHVYSEFSIDIPPKTYRNGTMYLHMVLVNDIGVEFEWRNLKREGLTVLQRIPLTEYIVPRPATFNLLNENEACKIFHWNYQLWFDWTDFQ